MREHKITEEQLKDSIFDTFSKCHSETATSRLQVYYPTLCAEIYKWYSDYLHIYEEDDLELEETSNFMAGLEIAEVIKRFLEDDKISKIPKDKDGFFKYLSTSIKKEKTASLRDYNENDTIKIPKEKKRKLRQVEDFIRMTESNLGRKLTTDECRQSVSKWFKNQEYVDLLNAMNASSTTPTNNEGSEIDVFDYATPFSDAPLDDLIRKTNEKAVLEAVKSLIEKKQKRSRECYRALFTLYCIENYKNFEYLAPVLDRQMLEIWQKDGKKPKQYEIYQTYHPNAQKSSAEAMASTNLKEFLADIETRLKEKNP